MSRANLTYGASEIPDRLTLGDRNRATLLADEEKHHAMLRTMTSKVDADLTGVKSGTDMPKLGAKLRET